MVGAGVVFVTPARVEPNRQVAVFLDIEGNRWDLLSRVVPPNPRLLLTRP